MSWTPGKMERIGLGVAALVVALDQLSKWAILAFLPAGGASVLPFFDLTLVHNPGVSFGLLRANTPVQTVLLLIMSLAIAGGFYWVLRSAENWPSALALGAIIGGAVGNMIDRARFGYVIDFLDFSFFPPVFNVADAAITLGAVYMLYEFFAVEVLAGRRAGRERAAPDKTS